jgi:hypothetical protein
MIVYHGSNIIIENIDLNKCRPYKDFGKGFYCTTIKSQAELMAKRVAAIYVMIKKFYPRVNVYSL